MHWGNPLLREENISRGTYQGFDPIQGEQKRPPTFPEAAEEKEKRERKLPGHSYPEGNSQAKGSVALTQKRKCEVSCLPPPPL